MKKLLIFVILGLTLISLSCNKNKIENISFTEVTTKEECTDKNGIWYNSICWKQFDSQEIPKERIDNFVKKELEKINKTTVTINNTSYSVDVLIPENVKNKKILIPNILTSKYDTKTLALEIKFKNNSSTVKFVYVKLLQGDIYKMSEEEIKLAMLAQGKIPVQKLSEKTFFISAKGSIPSINKQKTYELEYSVYINAHIGAGTSTFKIKGTEAFLNGKLGTRTYMQIKNLIKNNPNVKTIVLQHVPGSVNDTINVHTGRILREAGLNTKVLPDSFIASGAVDLFTAGNKRIIEKGSKINVHSWCCVNNIPANQIPKEHPAHKSELEYLTMTLGDVGPDFYFFTLRAAPFESIKQMTLEELKQYNIGTTYLGY